MNIKQSATSITNHAADKFDRNADIGSQLHCSKNKGLYLFKRLKSSCWILRYTDLNGRRKKITVGKYPSVKPMDAALKAMQINLGIYEGEDPVELKQKKKEEARKRAAQTFKAFLEGPYQLHQSRKKDGGIHTINILKSNFKDWYTLPLSSLTKREVYAWQAKRETEIKRPTLTRAYGALKTMLNYAVAESFIQDNPIANVSLLKESSTSIQAAPTVTRRVLSEEEIKALQSSIQIFEDQIRQQRRNSRKHGKSYLADLDQVTYAHWFVPFFYCALHLGMRTGDLFSLRWEHIHFKNQRLVKVLEKTKHHHDPSKIDLPLNSTIHSVLTKWHTQQGKPDLGLVFQSPVTGQQLDRMAHKKCWDKVKKLAGEQIHQDLHFYTLRHHFVSTLVLSGTPLFVVARLAGHKSVKMIEKHYGHLAPSDAWNAMLTFENSLPI